jgi:hypothetical protein
MRMFSNESPQHVTVDIRGRLQWAPTAEIIKAANLSAQNEWIKIPLVCLPGNTSKQKRSTLYKNMARLGLTIRTSIQGQSIFVQMVDSEKCPDASGRPPSPSLNLGIAKNTNLSVENDWVKSLTRVPDKAPKREHTAVHKSKFFNESPQHVTMDIHGRVQWVAIVEIITATNLSAQNEWVEIPLACLPGVTSKEKRTIVYKNMTRFGLKVRTSIQGRSIFVQMVDREKCTDSPKVNLTSGRSPSLNLEITKATNLSVQNDRAKIPLACLPGKTPKQKRTAVYKIMTGFGLKVRTSIQGQFIFVQMADGGVCTDTSGRPPSESLNLEQILLNHTRRHDY